MGIAQTTIIVNNNDNNGSEPWRKLEGRAEQNRVKSNTQLCVQGTLPCLIRELHGGAGVVSLCWLRVIGQNSRRSLLVSYSWKTPVYLFGGRMGWDGMGIERGLGGCWQTSLWTETEPIFLKIFLLCATIYIAYLSFCFVLKRVTEMVREVKRLVEFCPYGPTTRLFSPKVPCYYLFQILNEWSKCIKEYSSKDRHRNSTYFNQTLNIVQSFSGQIPVHFKYQVSIFSCTWNWKEVTAFLRWITRH